MAGQTQVASDPLREALETLFTAAIGGGLGKASFMYGSLATLGAKPGRTSASFKPGMEGATPAQLEASFKPGMEGVTPAQLEHNLAMQRQGTVAVAEKAARKRALEVSAGHGDRVESNKREQANRKNRTAMAIQQCNHAGCGKIYKSSDALHKHRRISHPYCMCLTASATVVMTEAP